MLTAGMGDFVVSKDKKLSDLVGLTVSIKFGPKSKAKKVQLTDAESGKISFDTDWHSYGHSKPVNDLPDKDGAKKSS